MTYHGSPCWYELSTEPGKLKQAEKFYSKVLGWKFDDAGMEGFTYHLAKAGGDMVAGAMEMPEDTSTMPPFWMVYFAVTDADAAVASMVAAGAVVHRPVMPIPGTGRFAILADPQGAGFGILEPEPMENGGAGGAFDQKKEGHGNWHELMSTDPKAAMGFYRGQLGWTPSTSMDMGPMGSYDLFAWNGTDIGGMMRSTPDMPGPGGSFWMPYFGTDSASAAAKRIKSAGGSVKNGPMEVPGGAYIVAAADPQGAMFAVVGAK
jgi:predicted enzyme related to lactoylglutathione lyase